TYVNGPLDNSAGAPMGQQLAAFLMGLPGSGSLDLNDNYAERSSIWGTYIQDDWKLTSKLTLNLGLRWEIEQPTTERYNRTVAGFNPTAALSISGAALANYAASPIAAVPANQFKVAGGFTYAGANGVDRGLWQTDRNNFMPRIGLAYSINPKTVVRSGFGFFYDQLGIRNRHVSQVGYSQSTAYNASLDSGVTYVAPLADPFPNGFVQPVGNSLGAMTSVGNSITFFKPSIKTPYSKRWEFSIQRQIGKQILAEIAYVGNHGSALTTTRQANAIPRQYYSTLPTRDQTTINFFTKNVSNPFYSMLPGTGLSGTKVAQTQLTRPFPQFTGVSYETNEGYSDYHSLQARLEKRMSAGLTLSSAYTWSKFLEATSFLNDTDPAAARVISDQDRTHRVVISGLYELPFGKGRRFGASVNPVLGKLIEGWQIQSIYQYQSGQAIGFTNAILYGTVDQIPLSAGERSVDRWFNTDIFERTSSKQLANNLVTMSPRFSGLRADGLNVCDVSVMKSTQLVERVRLQFRTEFINAFNHAMFKAPNTTMTSSAFGKVTATSQWPRSIQMSLKLVF
ncbi:MAG: TonB-dependent receptor, partial [Bryobacteraceae bacterium]